ncbi:MAG: hypothetical protein NC218_07740 [Acetobacter sp.]|nr:hypothetical protein [Acetobacter sp.]
MKQKTSNHTIINLMVFCLAATSCVNNQERDDNPKQEYSSRTASRKFDWDEATIIDAFNAGEIKSLDDFVNKSPHITDTVIVNKDNYKGRLCAGLYQPGKDKVYLKCFVPDLTDCTPEQEKMIIASVRKWNNRVLKMTDKAHESHHRYIHKKGVFSLPNSAEDYARLCAHNEIAAYTNTLLYEREIVKQVIIKLPASVWRNMISKRFSEYWDAVEQQKVHLDNVLLNNEQEDNYLISKTVFNWWMKNEYTKNVHISNQRIETYLTNNKWAINYPRNPENYERALNICYTFVKDGKLINLNRYFKQHIEMELGINDFPYGTKYNDIDNQPEVKEAITKIRNKPGNLLYDNKPQKKVIKVKKIIKASKKQGR